MFKSGNGSKGIAQSNITVAKVQVSIRPGEKRGVVLAGAQQKQVFMQFMKQLRGCCHATTDASQSEAGQNRAQVQVNLLKLTLKGLILAGLPNICKGYLLGF